MAAPAVAAEKVAADKIKAQLPRLIDWVMDTADSHRRFRECREDVRIVLDGTTTLTLNTVPILSRFAIGLYKEEDYAEAEKALVRLLAYKRAQDPASFGSFNTWNNWALCLAEIPARVAEAEREQHALLVSVRALHGRDHVTALAVWRNWATTLIKVERVAEAEDELRQLHAIRVQQDGKHSEKALSTLAYCAYATCKSGRREQGLAELRKVLAVLQKVHGSNHARTKDAEDLLADVSAYDADESGASSSA